MRNHMTNVAGGGDVGPPPTAHWDYSDNALKFIDAGITPVSSDGDLVYQVNDKSGNGFHQIQTDESFRLSHKLNRINGLSTVLGDVGNPVMGALGIMPDTSAFTIISVFQSDLLTNPSQIRYGFGSALIDGLNTRVHFNPATDSSLRYDGSNTSGSLGVLSASTTYVRTTTKNGVVISDWINQVLNIDEETANLNTVVDDFYIGNLSLINVGDLDYGEIKVYDSELPIDDITAIQNQLLTKWVP